MYSGISHAAHYGAYGSLHVETYQISCVNACTKDLQINLFASSLINEV